MWWSKKILENFISLLHMLTALFSFISIASYGALGHMGIYPLDFQQPIFSVNSRAAQSLTATLYGFLSEAAAVV